MKPILFSKTASIFESNGLGRLDCVECKVTEERNGQYELEMVVPETGTHASEIEMSSIIGVIPHKGGTIQPFRVYKITKPLNGLFAVYAQHISYQLSYIPVMPFSVQASVNAANESLQKMTSPVYCAEDNPFTFWTDVNTVASFEVGAPASIRSCLGGVEGSILDQFGGEYEWDKYTVKLWKHRGVTTPTVTLKYGKNLTDLSQEEYISNTITGVCPFWRDAEGNNLVTLTEKVVESQYADNYPFRRTVPLDLSQDFDSEPTEAQLRTNATAYLNASGIGIPTVSIKVSFVNLSDTEEYRDRIQLQTVKLCDMVKVEFEKLGISTTAKVVKTVFDVLKEKYESVEIGTIRTSLASTITDATGALTAAQSQLSTKFKQFGETVQDDITNATAWLTSADGVIQALKNSDGVWTDLLCCDTDATELTGNVLRLNVSGIGFSSSGWGGPFKQAWTLDGKLVIGGSNVPSLTVYTTDAETQTLFKVSRSGIIWNVQNSSMTEDGTLTANNLTANNATLNGTFTNTVYEGDPAVPVTMEISQARLTGYRNNVEMGHIEPGVRFRVYEQGQWVEHSATVISSPYIALEGRVVTRDNSQVNYYKTLHNGTHETYTRSNQNLITTGDLEQIQVCTGYEADGETLHFDTVNVVKNTYYNADVITGTTSRTVYNGLILESNLS